MLGTHLSWTQGIHVLEFVWNKNSERCFCVKSGWCQSKGVCCLLISSQTQKYISHLPDFKLVPSSLFWFPPLLLPCWNIWFLCFWGLLIRFILMISSHQKKSWTCTSVTDLLKQIFSWLWDVYPDVQLMSDLGALIWSLKFHHISLCVLPHEHYTCTAH